MGGGKWKASTYKAAKTYRTTHNISDFAYSDNGAVKVHADLNPKNVIRESRDSAEHPESTPVAVLFDVTGSMRTVPRALQAKLPALLGLLLLKGYLADPQIMFGAIGDATCDRAPLQVGQFESDNRMDENLGKIYLEGGGGGQKTESYELAMYFMARQVQADAWDRRRRRGYLFIIGDEMAYPRVKAREVAAVIGGQPGEDVALDAMVAELTARWETYYILPAGAAYAGDAQVLSFWRSHLGQQVIELDDLDAVAETIAMTIGLAEDAIDLDAGLADLADVGSSAGGTVGKALATLGSSRSPVVTQAAPPDLHDSGTGTLRL
jgi:hypothetical protein